MNHSVEFIGDSQVIVFDPAPKKEVERSGFFSWLSSLFKKKVTSQYAEQSGALDLLERKISSWNRNNRHTAVVTLSNIDVKAYESMKLSPKERLALQERVEGLQAIYGVQEGGVNYADIAAERNYEISTVSYIDRLVQESQSRDRRVALVARHDLMDLEVTSEHNSQDLNNYLIEELSKAQEVVQVLIDAEARLAAKLQREADILKHKEIMTDGGEIDLPGEMDMIYWRLTTTPFSRPLLNEFNAFTTLEEIAELKPDDALYQIEKNRDQIIAGGAGKELEKLIDQLQTQAEAKIEELKSKLKETTKLHKKSKPYMRIYNELEPLREFFSSASTLRSLDQTIALIEHKIDQLDGAEVASTQGLETNAIDPFQAQQILLAKDADLLEERMERLIGERDRLAAATGLQSSHFEEGRITLRQAAAKAKSLIMQEDRALHQIVHDLGIKRRIYTLVLEENTETEKILGEMKAKALMEGRPDLVEKIGEYHDEAQSHNGFFYENISEKITVIEEQIARQREEAPKTATAVTTEYPYKRMETLSFPLQSIAGIAKRAVKKLGKEHPKLAKRLKKVSLSELSDATKLGARATNLYLEKFGLAQELFKEQSLLKDLAKLRPALRSASTH